MNTRFISLDELRQHTAVFAGQHRRKKERLILQSKDRFFFELRPLTKKEIAMEKLTREIQEAEEDIKAGRVYATDQVRKKLGHRQ